MAYTFKVEGIVLFRFNYKDADRIVTIYTKERGKLSMLAKGSRKISSKKKGSLEPATHGHFYCVSGRSLHILTQTQIIKSYSNHLTTLERFAQLNQILEIINVLTVESQESPEVFALCLKMLENLQSKGPKKQHMLRNFRDLLELLGFTHDKQFNELTLKNYIEEITQRKLKTKQFMIPQASQLQV